MKKKSRAGYLREQMFQHIRREMLIPLQ